MNTRIFAAEGIQAFFKRWKGTINNPSTVVNTAIERYNYLLIAHAPSLTISEWGLVFDITAEQGVITTQDIPTFIKVLIQGIYMREDLTSKWEIDIEALAKKLTEFTTVEVVALIDIAERYLTTHTFEGIGLPFKSRVVQ